MNGDPEMSSARLPDLKVVTTGTDYGEVSDDGAMVVPIVKDRRGQTVMKHLERRAAPGDRAVHR